MTCTALRSPSTAGVVVATSALTMPYVVSDVDDTIIRGKSLVGFVEHLLLALPAYERRQLRSVVTDLTRRMEQGEARASLNRAYYEGVLRDRCCQLVREVAREWFEESSRKGNFFNSPVCQFLAGAVDRGASVVLLSGSFAELLEPIAKAVKATALLVAPLERIENRFTGRLLGSPTVEHGKVSALMSFLDARGCTLGQCAGIGDDLTDEPFLSAVGAPVVPATGHLALVEHARRSGWLVLGDRDSSGVAPG